MAGGADGGQTLDYAAGEPTDINDWSLVQGHVVFASHDPVYYFPTQSPWWMALAKHDIVCRGD